MFHCDKSKEEKALKEKRSLNKIVSVSLSFDV